MYVWIKEVEQRRTDLNTLASPGREFDESFAALIAGKLDADPHLSASKLAQSLGMAASTLCRYLTEVLGMKCQHLRWMLALTPVQKVMPTESAQTMLQTLPRHKHMNHHYLFTGDESWMFDAYDHRTRWVASWDDIDEIERPSHFRQKLCSRFASVGQGNSKFRFFQRDKI
jgi:AraC-like DNA-binding protein